MPELGTHRGEYVEQSPRTEMDSRLGYAKRTHTPTQKENGLDVSIRVGAPQELGADLKKLITGREITGALVTQY